jgi:hypothetical protein
MRRLFLYLLKKYSRNEKDRVVIYQQLWDRVQEEYKEQTSYGNVYNMNIEVLMSIPFIQGCLERKDAAAHIQMLKSGLYDSFDRGMKYIQKEKIQQ